MRTLLIGWLLLAPLLGHAAPSMPAYWIWPDMPIQERIGERELYVLQGRLTTRGGELLLERRGIRPRKLPRKDARLHLVIRMDRPVPAREAARFIDDRIRAWEFAGQPVAGVQIDFDAPSLKLSVYARFLKELRAHVPRPISITGLGDWVLTASQADLAQLYSGTDEIFFQLYQEREPLLEVPALVEQLSRFGRPFRVGLLTRQYRDLAPYRALLSNPRFNGFVLFR